MSANLVIVESPAKAKTIEKFLGKDYTVKASFGHVRDLPSDKLSVNTAAGFQPDYIVPADKKKVVAELKNAAAAAQTIWLASDEDREGEAIAWHLAETLHLPADRTKRIVFHEITKNAILHAVENPRGIDMNLVRAQQARRVLDRLVGYELSPVLWKKIRSGLSAGRVQSVAVRLIVDREREINAFNAQQYYKVEGVFSLEGGARIRASLEKKFESAESARAFLEQCRGTIFSIADVQKKEAFRTPPPPFTTSLLQQEASRKLGMSVNQTMSIAQKLYEAGLITYMRTDSTNLSSLAINTAKGQIISTFGEEYSQPRNYKTRTKGAQEAHEAIRPTYIDNSQINGTASEKRLYELIWKRTIASQMADARLERTTVALTANGLEERFVAQEERILFDGFLKVYIEGTDDEEEETPRIQLPEMKNGMKATYCEINATETYTQAPPRYSEASLVKKLEELGIGRPSTYGPTIKTIKDRGYVIEGNRPAETRSFHRIKLSNDTISTSSHTEKCGAEKRKLFPENIGIAVTDYLGRTFPDIVDYGFTARVEEEFDKIAEGDIQWNKMIGEFYTPFHQSVGAGLAERIQKDERELGVDPATGKSVIARIARFGAVVQLGADDDPQKKFAGLEKGQLIESITLEDALRLLSLPRTVAQYQGADVVAAVGSHGPYIRFTPEGSPKARFASIPKEMSPYTLTAEEALKIIDDELKRTAIGPIAEFPQYGIQVLSGRYGPYIKCNGQNYKIPRSIDPASLDAEKAKSIVDGGTTSSRPKRAGSRRNGR
ncbi:MAG: type I DNA topoisomerase [Bacteroidales bacterium]|nr:type I DNA topoisomerase [Bacteroidales bacterium]